jgi:subtilisin-like proprotein convertase family protein
VCTQWCQELADCPNPNGTCLDLGLPGASYCLAGCDPRDPSNGSAPFFACGAGQGCAPVLDGNSICVIPDVPGAVGAYCYRDSECAPGLGCGFDYDCAEWCLAGESDCTSFSASCFERYGAFAAGLDFGLCREAAESVLSTSAPLPIEDLTTTSSPIAVTSSLAALTRATVEVNIRHNFVGDLRIELETPDGRIIRLVSEDVLSPTADMLGTRFDDHGDDISDGWASPYQGSFAPEMPLDDLVGMAPTGTWVLHVSDTFVVDEGTLTNWRLHFW